MKFAATSDPSGIDVASVAQFLNSQGWTQVETRRTGSIWRAPNRLGRGDIEVFVPRDGVEGFSRRIRDLISDLAEIENVSEPQIRTRIVGAARDRVSLRIMAPEATQGELPFNYARHMLGRLHAVLVAGARAAHQPLANFQSSRPAIVNRYLDGLVLGQTKVGSFVVDVMSPVPEDWPTSLLHDSVLTGHDVPFERRATMSLMSGVSAAQELVNGGRLDENTVDRAVDRGLSSNLCHALSSLRTKDVKAAVDLQVAWASIRQMPTATTTVELGGAVLEALPEIASVLRQRRPVLDQEVAGFVTELRKVATLDGGSRIVLKTPDLPGRARTLHLELHDDAAIRRATDAYVDGSRIRLQGDLHPGGTRWAMEAARLLS